MARQSVKQLIMRRVLVGMLLVALFLATAGSVWAASGTRSPRVESCPCAPGVACCVTYTHCGELWGWECKSLCVAGYQWWHTVNYKQCYDTQCNLISTDVWCTWSFCGSGQCQ